MKSLLKIAILLLFSLNAQAKAYETNEDIQSQAYSLDMQRTQTLQNRLAPVFMIVLAIGIAGIWTNDIVRGRFSGQGNFFHWIEGENKLWPHILVEYLTASGLLAGGFGLYYFAAWALPVSFISLGAVIYSAINSSGWIFLKKERLPYGIPIWIALVMAVLSIFLLLPVFD
jgi:hypothetical protein